MELHQQRAFEVICFINSNTRLLIINKMIADNKYW